MFSTEMMGDVTSDRTSGYTTENATSTHHPQYPQSASIHYNFLHYATIPVSILILLMNGPVIIAIIKNSKLHSPTFAFIFCLSVADLWVGAVSLGRVIIYTESDYTLCLLRISFMLAPVCASLCFMFWIGADRLISIQNPLKYTQRMTKLRCGVATGLTWLYALVVGMSPLMGFDRDFQLYQCSFIYVVNSTFIWFAAISFLLPLAGVIAIYGKIFSVARKHLKKINNIESSLGNNYNALGQTNTADIRPRSRSFPSTMATASGHGRLQKVGHGHMKTAARFGKRLRTQSLNISGHASITDGMTSSGYVSGGSEMTAGGGNPTQHFSVANQHPQNSLANLRQEVRKNHIKRTLKAVRTLLVILGCFLATWGPFIVSTIVQQVCYSCHLHDVIGTYLLLLGLCNSFLNPMVYAYWNKDFRHILQHTLRLNRCCKQPLGSQRSDVYELYQITR